MPRSSSWMLGARAVVTTSGSWAMPGLMRTAGCRNERRGARLALSQSLYRQQRVFDVA